jgi:hypothetical protein
MVTLTFLQIVLAVMVADLITLFVRGVGEGFERALTERRMKKMIKEIGADNLNRCPQCGAYFTKVGK